MLKLMFILAAVAQAESTMQPCDQAKAVYDQIRPQAKTSSWSREGDVCTIEYTPKDGVTVTFTDRQSARAALLSELNALEDKLDSGLITPPQRDRIIKIMLKLNRFSRDAQ